MTLMPLIARHMVLQTVVKQPSEIRSSLDLGDSCRHWGAVKQGCSVG